MKITASILFLALSQSADAFSAPAGQKTLAPWTEAAAPGAPGREMPQPYGNVAPIPDRVAGAYNQQATGNWWDRRQEINSHSDINTSAGFPVYTDMNKGPPVPETERRTGKWWDRPGDVNSHVDINTSAGFNTYTDMNKGPAVPKNDGPNPVRVAGAYNQQATGNWWDRRQEINSHSDINTSAGFPVYTDMNKGPSAPEYERRTGKWWDRPGDVNSHVDINTSAGFNTYTDINKGPAVPKNDGPNPMRVAGAYNQQATGNWWDRRQEINAHDDIKTSAGFPTYTDIMRERSQ